MTVSGRVVDLRGEGVPVAEVWVGDPDGEGDDVRRTFADGEGFFRIGGVPAGTMWIYGTADGRSVGSDYVRSASDTATIELHDAAVVRGVVRGRDGAPVPGAVVATYPSGRALSRRVRTVEADDEGRFELASVPLGLSQFMAWVPEHGLASARRRVAGDTNVELVCEDMETTDLQISIAGLPEDDAPGVRMSVLPYFHGSLTYLPPPYYRPVIEGGEWSAEGVPDWRYTIRLSADGWTFAPNVASLKEGQGPHQLSFTASKVGTAKLRCPARVVDQDGLPVGGVSFVLRRSNGGPRATATSDGDGKLAFESPLAAGTTVVVYSTTDEWVVDQEKVGGMIGVHDRRFLEDHECEVDPERELLLRVAPATTVRGQLLLPDGRPAAFVSVQLEEEKSNRMPRWMTFAYATTDRDGRFRFRRLHHSPDNVRLLVEGRHGAATGEPISIAAVGGDVELQPVTLTLPATIEGVVRDADGEVVPGVAVWLRDWNMLGGGQRSGSVTEVITDGQGRYRFVGVPLGGAWLQLVADEELRKRVKACEPFEVEAGKTYTVDLVEE